MRISVGTKLYMSVLSVFLVFAVAFIVFQQTREKQFKVDTLNLKLQDYNLHMDEYLRLFPDRSEQALDRYVKSHYIPHLRVTLISLSGKVMYDSELKDYSHVANHASRPEIVSALHKGAGSTVERNSKTLKGDFFYSATCFPKDSLIIRSALPYTSDLSKSLKADQHYIWFAVATMLLLTIILYRFTRRLGDNIHACAPLLRVPIMESRSTPKILLASLLMNLARLLSVLSKSTNACRPHARSRTF